MQVFKNDNKKISNFAIVALGWLGDSLLTSGLCKNIKHYNPDAKITFVCLKNFQDIPELIPEVDEIVAYDKNEEHKSLFAFFNFAKNFKCNNKIDVAIVVHPHERSVLCAKFLGAKKIVSLNLKGKFNLINFLITKKRQYIEDEIRNVYKNFYNADYLKVLGIETEKFFPELEIKASSGLTLAKYNLPDKYIVLVPESKDKLKNWDYKNISSFIKNCDIPIVLTGTQKTDKLAKKIEKDGVSFINLCGKTSILELALLVKQSYAVVSVDTGSMHLAYGLGVDTVCLFFMKDMINEWLPLNLSNVHLLVGEKKYSNKKILTTKEISYTDVLNVIKNLK